MRYPSTPAPALFTLPPNTGLLQAQRLATLFPKTVKDVVGNFREDLVVHMSGRITDLENFSIVLATLTHKEQCSVGRRLGWLNILNPHYPDRFVSRLPQQK